MTANTDTESDSLSRDQLEELIFETPIDWETVSGDHVRIGPRSAYMDSGISLNTVETLISEQNRDDSQAVPAEPTMRTLAEFGRNACENYDCIEVEYDGYMIGPDRPDSRTIIDVIAITAHDESRIPWPLRRRFTQKFRHADEFKLTYKLCSARWRNF